MKTTNTIVAVLTFLNIVPSSEMRASSRRIAFIAEQRDKLNKNDIELL